MVGEGVPQVTCSHTKLSGLYRKIHAKTGADQGLEDQENNLFCSSFFKYLRHPKQERIKRKNRGGGEEAPKIKKHQRNDHGTSKREDPFL